MLMGTINLDPNDGFSNFVNIVGFGCLMIFPNLVIYMIVKGKLTLDQAVHNKFCFVILSFLIIFSFIYVGYFPSSAS